MAIIFTYPTKTTPTLADTVIITDSESEDPENRTKQTSLASIKALIDDGGGGTVGGSGTANTIPKWSDSNTLTDSPFTIDTSTSSLDMPALIRHIGDTDSTFGFQADNHFRVQTGGQTTIQSIFRTDELGNTGQVAGLYFNGSQRFFTRGGGVEVEGSIFMPGYIRHLGENDSFFGFSAGDNFILNTDSGTKIAAGPGIVTLYSDTSETATTTSVARFATATTGAIVYGQTIAAGAASERGGIIRFNNNANDRFVGISGPVTQGTNYQVRLPDSVGTAGQVLKLNNPLISGQTQDLVWGDASATSGTGGFETLPLTTANGYITATGTYVFQMIAPSNLGEDGPANFKFYNLLAQIEERTVAVAIYKGDINNGGSLQSTGEIAGVLGSNRISGSTLTVTDGATAISAGDNIVVCLSFDSNISLLGVIPITANGGITLTNASPVSNEKLAQFDTTSITASEFPGTITELFSSLSGAVQTTTRPFLLIY